MRILYYIGAIAGKGGVERVLAEKSNYFINQFGWEIHIMTEDQRGRDLPYLFNKNIHFHDLQTSLYSPKYIIKGFTYLQMILRVRTLAEKKIEEIAPDIISVLDIGFCDFVVPYICKNIPKIREFHSSKEAAKNFSKEMPFLKRIHYRGYRFLYYRQFKKYSSLVLLTERDFKAFGCPSNGCVIPNTIGALGSDKTVLSNSFHTKKRIISVGSMANDQKGFSVLIQIAPQIKNKYPDWSLHIYGDGPYKAKYQEMIDKSELSDFVFLEGATNDIISKLRDSDFFVFTSKGEGFPMVLIEAQSQYLPAISYDTPCGPSEIITNGIDGFIVKMNDTKDLIEKIFLLIENEDLRAKMCSNAYKNSLRFSPENIMPMWIALFDKLVQHG